MILGITGINILSKLTAHHLSGIYFVPVPSLQSLYNISGQDTPLLHEKGQPFDRPFFFTIHSSIRSDRVTEYQRLTLQASSNQPQVPVFFIIHHSLSTLS